MHHLGFSFANILSLSLVLVRCSHFVSCALCALRNISTGPLLKKVSHLCSSSFIHMSLLYASCSASAAVVADPVTGWFGSWHLMLYSIRQHPLSSSSASHSFSSTVISSFDPCSEVLFYLYLSVSVCRCLRLCLCLSVSVSLCLRLSPSPSVILSTPVSVPPSLPLPPSLSQTDDTSSTQHPYSSSTVTYIKMPLDISRWNRRLRCSENTSITTTIIDIGSIRIHTASSISSSRCQSPDRGADGRYRLQEPVLDATID